MSHEMVDEQAKLQIMEELQEALHKQDMSKKAHHALTFAGLEQAHLEGVSRTGRSGQSTPGSNGRTPRTSNNQDITMETLEEAIAEAKGEVGDQNPEGGVVVKPQGVVWP